MKCLMTQQWWGINVCTHEIIYASNLMGGEGEGGGERERGG